MLFWAKARDTAEISFKGIAGIFTGWVFLRKLPPVESRDLTRCVWVLEREEE